jgi:NADPH:quinone reductase-like Zn-dependent oxidoreductase
MLVLLSSVQATVPTTMRAAITTEEQLKSGDFTKIEVTTDRAVPKPGQGQVLIRAAASSVNPVDFKLLENAFGKLPLNKALGFDMAGTIEQVGPGCIRLKVGDEVWADLGLGLGGGAPEMGAWADYALAEESQVGLKPTGMSFAEAGSLPLVALTDYQAFKKCGAPWGNSDNFTVVITSGSGGTGLPAIQLAKAFGATRIVVGASASHTALLKGLGATDVIDYHTSTIWAALADNSVDVVYDNYGAPGTADAAMASLRTGGSFIFLPGKGGDLSKHPKEGVKQMTLGIVDPSHYEDLDVLKTVVDKGQLKAIIQKSYPLEEIVTALNVSAAGHTVGKISIGFKTSTSVQV